MYTSSKWHMHTHRHKRRLKGITTLRLWRSRAPLVTLALAPLGRATPAGQVPTAMRPATGQAMGLATVGIFRAVTVQRRAWAWAWVPELPSLLPASLAHLRLQRRVAMALPPPLQPTRWQRSHLACSVRACLASASGLGLDQGQLLALDLLRQLVQAQARALAQSAHTTRFHHCCLWTWLLRHSTATAYPCGGTLTAAQLQPHSQASTACPPRWPRASPACWCSRGMPCSPALRPLQRL